MTLPTLIELDTTGFLTVQAIDYSNLTVANISSKYFPTFITNSTSVANSAFFLLYFSFVLVYTIIQMLRARKSLVRNQLILYILLSLFILIYMFALIFRLIYNGIGLYVNLNSSKIDKPSILVYQQVMWASGFTENFVAFFQMIPIGIFIMGFIQYVFLSTVRKANAMSKIVYRVVLGFVIGATIISFLICFALCVMNAVFNLLKKTGDVKFDVTPIYASLFVLYISITIFQILIFLSSGIRLIQTIKMNRMKNSNNNNSNSFIEIMNSPYTKILLLVTGILACKGILMMSVLVSIITSLYLPNYHIIDYFLHGFGVAVFAFFVLFTYSPYWAKKANNYRRQSVVSAISPLDSIPNTDDFTSPTTPTEITKV